jgi:tRNA-modifying protein YgfZ
MSNTYEALRARGAWLDLTGRGLIRVTGEDAARLLHAMSTNDVHAMQPGGHRYAFFLNPQGRILAEAWILRREDHYLLDTEPGLRQPLYEHLDKFIIADDVTLEDVSDQYRVVSLETPGGRDFSAVGFPDAHRHYLAAGEAPATDLPLATAAEAEIVRLENGRPRYGADITDRYLVQETQQMQAISFTKGCYLGQEIVERVRARGAVHKHLLSFTIDTATPPAEGTEIISDATKAGVITSAAFSPAYGKVVAMGYLNVAFEKGDKPLALSGNLAERVLVQRPHAV